MQQRPPTPSQPQRKGSSIPRPVPLVTVLMSLALALAACAPSAAPTATGTAPVATQGAATGSPGVSATSGAGSPMRSPRQPPSPAGSPSGAACPGTLVDDEGTELRLEAEPERVVSLSPATTEIVFALGQGEKVVGGSNFDDYPPEAAALPDVATFEGVNIEAIVDLDADLVVASGDLLGGAGAGPSEPVTRLRSLGIPVLVVEPKTVEQILAGIRLIGCAIGAGEEAGELTDGMKQRMEAIEAAASAVGERPRVFYELGNEPELYGLTDGSYTADLVRRAGGDPITTGSETNAVMPLERLVDQDPEVIVLGDANYGVTPEQVKQRPGGWKQMTAVKNDAIRPVDDIVVTRPGPRLAQGLEELARAIHPDIALPGPAR